MSGGAGQQQSLGIQPQNRLRRQRDRRGSPPIFRLGQEVLRSEIWQLLLDETGVVGLPYNKEPVFSIEESRQPPAGQRQQRRTISAKRKKRFRPVFPAQRPESSSAPAGKYYRIEPSQRPSLTRLAPGRLL